jgi:hypothetical protein
LAIIARDTPDRSANLATLKPALSRASRTAGPTANDDIIGTIFDKIVAAAATHNS